MTRHLGGRQYELSSVLGRVVSSGFPVHLVDASDPENLRHSDGTLRYNPAGESHKNIGYLFANSGNPSEERPICRKDFKDAILVDDTWFIKIDSSKRREKRLFSTR